MSTSLPAACGVCSASLLADARFCARCGSPVAPNVVPVGGAERRQTTIMFCDSVGSTALSEKLDPEDLREVLHAFRDVVKSVVARHGGFVASYMGDGALVLFSYPRAHEDDPERALRAALELVVAIQGLVTKPDVHLEARVGIATGLVVIGPLVGRGISLDEVVIGQTTNLAARLQALAGPNSIVVAESTKRLVERTFECSSLGEHPLKGFAKPVPAWLVVRERQELDAPMPATRVVEGTPLVGRERELSVLREHWQEVRRGSGHLVVIQGDPGVGKSRLLLALRELVASEPHRLLRYLCAPRFQDSALFPVIHEVERAARFSPDDGPEQKLDKLEAFVEHAVPTDDRAGLTRILAALLALPFEGRYEPLVDSAERLKQRTFVALKDSVYAAAREVPVLLVVEDLHWADPTTIELIDELLTGMAERPILVVVTVRPGFAAKWPKRVNMTRLDLERLSLAESKLLIEQIGGSSQLPSEVIAHILDKAEGVPLFIEELTRAVLDSGKFERSLAAGAEGGPRSTLLAIPSTLQDSLASRLDRLASGKQVAQVAAAIGREFSYEVLREVLVTREIELNVAVQELAAADLIRAQDETHGLYRFKHALLQDAAYSMMVRDTRQVLHRRIAEVLERQRKSGRSVDPDVLSHHWIEAEEVLRAVPYLEEAAQLASAHAAHTEARRHLLRGLELLGGLPPSPRRDEHELRLSVGLGLSASATQGYAAPEVEAAYQRSLELCRRLGNHAELFPSLRGLSTFYIVRGALATARDLSEECLRVAEHSGRPADLIESATALGYTLVYQGELENGRAQLARAVELYRASAGEGLSYPSLQDPAVASLCLQAAVAAMVGEGHASERLEKEALELAERLGRPFNRAYAHSFAALRGNLRLESKHAAAHAECAIAIASEHGFPVWVGAATMHHAIAKGVAEEPQAMIPVLSHMLGLWQAGGAELNRSFFLWGLSRCQRAAGDTEAALATVEDALAQSARSGELFLLSELRRLKGELLHERSPTDEAAWSEQLALAAASARKQRAFLLELRALTALVSRRAPSEASSSPELQRLATLVARFNEASEQHPELRAASALLAR